MEMHTLTIKYECIYYNCDSHAYYSIDPSNTPTYCYNHYINLFGKLYINNNNNRTFLPNLNQNLKNINNIKSKNFSNPINELKNKTLEKIEKGECVIPQCEKSAKWRYIGSNKFIYCSNHKNNETINAKFTPCIIYGCMKEALYGFMHDIKPSYCSDHLYNDMFDLVTKKCIIDGCKEVAILGFKGDLIPTYCPYHSPFKVVTIKKTSCKKKNCSNIALYKINPEDKDPSYCPIHIQNDMEKIFVNTCNEENCSKIPSFCLKGEKYPRFCSDHKDDKIMINIRKHVPLSLF